MPSKEDSYPTRASLLERVKDSRDERSWEEFHGLYGPLVRRFALKAGLTEAEAEDVVQETMSGAAQHLPGFRYEPQRCSFKTWLMNLARWRVTDQFRKRLAGISSPGSGTPLGDGSRTPTMERVADPAGEELERVWEGEWRAALLGKALERVKGRVNLKQWQMFDLYVLKEWSAGEVASALHVSRARVYLNKHRVGNLVTRELRRLEDPGS
jgi:RNA polymerase sigma-70 factor (ECF subfamily)